jgi:hypothetical protein
MPVRVGRGCNTSSKAALTLVVLSAERLSNARIYLKSVPNGICNLSMFSYISDSSEVRAGGTCR